MRPVSIAVLSDPAVPIDRWLATELARILDRPVPRGLARKAIVGGLVSIAGRTVRDPGLVLRRGPSVFVRSLNWLPVPEAEEALTILFEDAWGLRWVLDREKDVTFHEVAP